MDQLCLTHSHQGKPTSHYSSTVIRSTFCLIVGSCAALWLTGCASPPPQAAKALVSTPPVVSLDELMVQARIALNEGNREKARAVYRAAAQSHPSEKLPWLRLSEDYFNAQDYGNAVIAAQEVLQRDGQDSLAHSVLAVSGLRLTAGSLVALRQETAYPVGSRDEAITVARALRDALGATSLLTPVVTNHPAGRLKKPTSLGAATATTAAASSSQSAAPRAGSISVVPAAVVPVSTTSSGATRISAPAGSPLDKLK